MSVLKYVPLLVLLMFPHLLIAAETHPNQPASSFLQADTTDDDETNDYTVSDEGGESSIKTSYHLEKNPCTVDLALIDYSAPGCND